MNNTSPAKKSKQDFYIKVHKSILDAMMKGELSHGALSLYVLVVSNSKNFKPSRTWLLNNGYKRTNLLKCERELEDLGLLKISRGKGGRSYTTYYALGYDDLAAGKKFKQSDDPTVRETTSYCPSNNRLLSAKQQATVRETTRVLSAKQHVLINNTINKTNNTPLTPLKGIFESTGLNSSEIGVVSKYLKDNPRNLDCLTQCKKPAANIDLSGYFEDVLGRLEKAEPVGSDRRLREFQIKKLVAGVYSVVASHEMGDAMKRDVERDANTPENN